MCPNDRIMSQWAVHGPMPRKAVSFSTISPPDRLRKPSRSSLPEATFEARRNSYSNQVEDIRFFTGDLTILRGSFDLVVANLTLGIFRQMAADLVRLTGKTLIVSGFTEDQEGLVLDQFKLSSVRSWSRNGWCCHQLGR